MYETLLILKKDQTFSLEDMDKVVAEAASFGVAKYSREGHSFNLSVDGGFLNIGFSDHSDVLLESNEMAEIRGIDCAGATQRFEISGQAQDFDAHMDLFNEYLNICQTLNATGKFVIYDSQEGKLFEG